MRALAFVLPLFLFASAAIAAPMPPKEIGFDSHVAWVKSINAVLNPFTKKVFDWYENQKSLPLPPEVAKSADGLFVTLDRPIRETDELEGAGELEASVTYGLEAYADSPANVNLALEASLFLWGKPVGQREGTTYSFDPVFGARSEAIVEKWGPRDYLTTSIRTGGGIMRDLRDTVAVTVRGDEKTGYTLVGNFIAPAGKTETTALLVVVTMRPLPNGHTDYRLSARQLGQNYGWLGKDVGRRTVGFNYNKLRGGMVSFLKTIVELRDTGKIKENRPN